MEDDLEDLKGIMVEEYTEGKYDCSEFILSKLEKKRIHKIANRSNSEAVTEKNWMQNSED